MPQPPQRRPRIRADFVVADPAGRRANQPREGAFLRIIARVDAHGFLRAGEECLGAGAINGVMGQTYGMLATTDLGNTNNWVGQTNITLTVPPQL
jgi:hypothetical protein